MEKRGVIQPGLTPDVENRLPEAEKQAADNETMVELLDDDLTKRMITAVGVPMKSE